jgi:tripartite ATP-independent transporter DctM subunit
MILEYLDILMFLTLCVLILAGYPVIFTLAGIAIAFAGIGALTGDITVSLLGALGQRIFGVMTNEVLVAIPLFVFMGIVLERSKIAEELLDEMGRLFGSMRGGLAISVTVVGALLAASTGIVGATVVTMALIALPAMLRHGYDQRLAAGTVVTAGTLGQIIPPSTMLIILSEVMSTSFQQAQYEKGLFTVETLSVGQIFAAAILPGLALVGLYVLYILARAILTPAAAPPVAVPNGASRAHVRIFRALVPPIALIIAVLGSILGGVATPTEAASVGAVGALILAGFRLGNGRSNAPQWAAVGAVVAIVVLASITTIRPQRTDAGSTEVTLGILAGLLVIAAGWGITSSLLRARAAGVLGHVVGRTMTISAMIFGTIIGASVFSLVFRGLGGDGHIEAVLATMPGGEQGALLFSMALIFVLGFFLDFVEISVIILPIVGPALMIMGVDPIWLSMLIAINLQTSFLTPPFGFSLFYLRGAAPPEVSTGAIYAGVMPFIALQVMGMLVVWLFPALSTALPRLLFG